MLKIDRTGEMHITNEGYTIKIINCNGSKSCDVVFEDGTILTKVNYHQIKNGSVKNPYHKSVYGVAYFSFCSVFSATPLEAEIVVEESTADNLLREVVNQYPDIISGDFSAFAFRSLVDEIRDYLKRK